jgi:RNA polymerase sigma-70 factor, ECF subfamily
MIHPSAFIGIDPFQVASLWFRQEEHQLSLARRSALRIVEWGPGSLDLEGLIPSIATGDEQAMARFYNATSGLLFGLLLLILSDTATAEKVLSDVYAEVREHAVRFDRNNETLLTWLITIAHRLALEHLCASKEDQQFVISVGLADPPRSGHGHPFGLNKSAHRRLVGATLDALSPAERKMIELAYFSRMTPRAIAMKLRQSHDTVQSGLQSGVSQLYKLFKNQGFLSEA